MREIERKGSHRKLRDTKSRSMTSNPSMRRMANKSGDWKTGGIGQRHDNDRNQRKPKRNAQAATNLHVFGDYRELSRTSKQGESEHNHDHRRLGQRGEHHLAARAYPAEPGADIHSDEREE